MKALEINNLSKTYKNSIFKKKFRVLKNVCFNIDTGSIVGLVGPNGAGKSTAVKIILNLIIPTSGNIIISGEDHHNKNVRKKIGYLPETDKYPMYLTGNQFLKICSNFYKKKINKKKIKDLEIKLGLSQKLDLTINKYSKGMRKKLGFIQALQFEPELLILDEPIEGLDTEGKKVIVDILKDFKSNGNSVLINSHYLSELEKICDRIIIIKKGEITNEYYPDSLNSFKGYKISIQHNNGMDIISKVLNQYPVEILTNNLFFFKSLNIHLLNEFMFLLYQENVLISEVKRVKPCLEELYLLK